METVTVKMLEEEDACEDQVRLFRELFGDRAEFTPENQDKAERAGLDTSWFYRAFKLTGEVVSYWSDGSVKFRRVYQNGKRHGETAWYYKDGKVEWIENYKNGEPHGEFVGYYPDGSVKWRKHFKNGKPHGESVGYYLNGKVKCRNTYKNGKLIK